MFGSFFCDQLNGQDCYDYSDEYSEECSYSTGQSKHIDRIEKTYSIYGRLIRETPKAALYRFVKLNGGKYCFGEEKWLPKSSCNCWHISEFDQTHESFKDEFKVTGIDDIYLINIPEWLFHRMFKEPKKQVVFGWKMD